MSENRDSQVKIFNPLPSEAEISLKPKSIQIMFDTPPNISTTVSHILSSIFRQYSLWNINFSGTTPEKTEQKLRKTYYANSGPTPFIELNNTGEIQEWSTEFGLRIIAKKMTGKDVGKYKIVLQDNANGPHEIRVTQWIPEDWKKLIKE